MAFTSAPQRPPSAATWGPGGGEAQQVPQPLLQPVPQWPLVTPHQPCWLQHWEPPQRALAAAPQVPPGSAVAGGTEPQTPHVPWHPVPQ